MAVAASGAQQAVPVWAGVTTTSPPSTDNPASTAGLPASGNRARQGVGAPRRRRCPGAGPRSDGIPRSQVRTVAAGTVAVVPSMVTGSSPMASASASAASRSASAMPYWGGTDFRGTETSQRELLARLRPQRGQDVDRVDAPARLALDGDDAGRP